MTDRLITWALEYLVKKAGLPSEDREIYYYGLDLMLFSAINIISLTLLGLLAGKVAETLILLVLFGLMQTQGGGYHAATHFRCFLGMLLMWCITIYLLQMSQALGELFFTALGIAGTIAVFILAPIQHPNAPASREKLSRAHKIIRSLCIGLLGSFLICLRLFPVLNPIAYSIAIALAAYGSSLLFSHIKLHLLPAGGREPSVPASFTDKIF